MLIALLLAQDCHATNLTPLLFHNGGTPPLWAVFLVWYDATPLTGHGSGVVAQAGGLTSWQVAHVANYI
jgi:hypothetical protein